MPILESALGIENAFAIASASENVAALTIGLEDYTADLGVAKTSDGAESLYARTRAGECRQSREHSGHRLRFWRRRRHGWLCAAGDRFARLGIRRHGMHSSRRRSRSSTTRFRPSQAEIDKALKIVAAFEEAQQRGLGRGEPWIEDDRSTGRAARAEIGSASTGKWASLACELAARAEQIC